MRREASRLTSSGYLRIRLNGEYFELDNPIPFDKGRKNSLELVIDRLKIEPSTRARLLEAVERATALSGGVVLAALEKEDRLFNLAFSDLSTGNPIPLLRRTPSLSTPSKECAWIALAWESSMVQTSCATKSSKNSHH
jgi:excinuclease ABC subunit A